VLSADFHWPALLLGWPSAIAGAMFLVAGLVARRPGLSLFGAVAATGFCVYLGMNPPPIRWLGLLALVSNFASAFAVRKNGRALGLLTLTPFLFAVGYLLVRTGP